MNHEIALNPHGPTAGGAWVAGAKWEKLVYFSDSGLFRSSDCAEAEQSEDAGGFESHDQQCRVGPSSLESTFGTRARIYGSGFRL